MNTQELYRKHRATIRKMLLAKGGSTTEIKGAENQIEFVRKEYGIKTSAPESLDKYFTKWTSGAKPEAAEDSPAPEAAETKPAPSPAPEVDNSAVAGQLAGAIAGSVEQALAGLMKPAIDENQIIELIKQHANSALNIEITGHKDKPAIEINGAHRDFPLLLDIVQLAPVSGQNLYMYGPAGSGKTTIGKQLAKALDLPFYSTGAIFDKFELLGFNDVNGNYVETELYKAYTQGGLFLFDEIDGSAPEVLTAFNQLLANDSYAFPNGMQKKSPNFYAVAAANTNGLGATGAYSSRAVIDGATLDRFTAVMLGYDLQLEEQIVTAAAKAVNNDYDRRVICDWIDECRAARDWLAANNSDVIISPRATKGGAVLLAKGHDIETVRKVTIHAHLSEDQIKQLAA